MIDKKSIVDLLALIRKDSGFTIGVVGEDLVFHNSKITAFTDRPDFPLEMLGSVKDEDLELLYLSLKQGSVPKELMVEVQGNEIFFETPDDGCVTSLKVHPGEMELLEVPQGAGFIVEMPLNEGIDGLKNVLMHVDNKAHCDLPYVYLELGEGARFFALDAWRYGTFTLTKTSKHEPSLFRLNPEVLKDAISIYTSSKTTSLKIRLYESMFSLENRGVEVYVPLEAATLPDEARPKRFFELAGLAKNEIPMASCNLNIFKTMLNKMKGLGSDAEAAFLTLEAMPEEGKLRMSSQIKDENYSYDIPANTKDSFSVELYGKYVKEAISRVVEKEFFMHISEFACAISAGKIRSVMMKKRKEE